MTLSFASSDGTIEGAIDPFTGLLTVSSVAAIPEPGTWALWLAGLGAVGFVARRGTKPR